jgi:hypothetical protein
MNNLLDLAINAHGGWDRWQQISTLDARVSVAGGLWPLKGWPGVFSDARVALNAHRQQIEFAPFETESQHSLFEPGRVAIVDDGGQTVQERNSPRMAFDGHGLQSPWDALHVAYFSGYAMWGYLTSPFLFRYPGFQSEEMAPWDENGETWRRLKVTFPAGLDAHCREQIYYFDSQGLLRRNDYRVDIIGSGTTSAHYSSEHKAFGGIVFPTARRVYTIDADNRPVKERVLVAIDVHNVDIG